MDAIWIAPTQQNTYLVINPLWWVLDWDTRPGLNWMPYKPPYSTSKVRTALSKAHTNLWLDLVSYPQLTRIQSLLTTKSHRMALSLNGHEKFQLLKTISTKENFTFCSIAVDIISEMLLPKGLTQITKLGSCQISQMSVKMESCGELFNPSCPFK